MNIERRWIATLAIVVVAASGCVLDGRTDNPSIVNESGADVEILLVSPGAEDQPFVSIPAGQTYEVVQYSGSCLPNDMVARTETGQVVARTETLCAGDRWVIERPAG